MPSRSSADETWDIELAREYLREVTLWSEAHADFNPRVSQRDGYLIDANRFDESYWASMPGPGLFELWRSERGKAQRIFRTGSIELLHSKLVCDGLARSGKWILRRSEYEKHPYGVTIEDLPSERGCVVEWETGEWAEFTDDSPLSAALRLCVVRSAHPADLAASIHSRHGGPLLQKNSRRDLRGPKWNSAGELTVRMWKAWLDDGAVAREAAARELWRWIEGYPGLAKLLKVSERDLLEPYDPHCLISGDVAYKISLGGDGIHTLILSNRGEDSPVFRTNDLRAFAVQLAFRALLGSADFAPGYSPYVDLPYTFEIEQRREYDEYDIRRIVIRWLWDDGKWAEAPGRSSLLQGLEWAWMFTASDQTIANAVALDGWPLFRPASETDFPRPGGDTSDLTLEQWRAWVAESGRA